MNTHLQPDMSGASQLVAASATLPLESAALRVVAKGGIARVVLEQRFANHHTDPLALTYVLPLPADAAVSGYSFCIGDRRIEGEIDRRKAARERYEEAIARGQTAALLEQERSSLFTQEIGNVPPGARVVCEIAIDQRLRWLEEGAWEWRFPLAAAPRYLGEPGRVADAAALALAIAQTLAPRASLAVAIGDAVASGARPESPSHRLLCTPDAVGHRVTLDGGGAELDRDVVVRWPVAGLAPQVSVLAERTARGAHALLTIVPPLPESRPAVVPRDLIVLLDTSGSMAGSPLDQARRVAMALIHGLQDHDSFELIEFSSSPRRFAARARPATLAHRKEALAWLAALQARGGTEMRAGILEALRPLRADGQRQIVVITDGLIGFEQEIVAAILERLPDGSRVHMIGVGSSVNRSLTGPAARAGRGTEIVMGLGEDPERAVQRIRARTEAPLVVDVGIEGDALLETAPAKIPDLFAGCPVLVSAKLRPEGGDLVVRGRGTTGGWEQRVRVAPSDVDASVAATLFGREAVEDCEMRLAAGQHRAEIDLVVEQLGLDYRIATRLTSWIAIDKTPSVDPLAPTRREIVPQMLPYGMSVDGLGLRQAHVAPPPPPAGAGQLLAGSARRLRRLRRLTGSMGPPPSAAGEPAGARGKPSLTREEFDAQLEKARSKEAPADSARPSDADMPERSPAADLPAKRRPTPLIRGAFTGASSPVVRAWVAQRQGKQIAIEVQAPMELAWDPESFDVLLIVGGELTGRVDMSRTTRAGQLAPGQIARITIVLDSDSEARVVQIVFARQAFVVA